MGIISFMCQSKTIRNDYFYLKNESRDWGSSNNFLLLYLLRHWLYSLIVLLFLPLIFISGYIRMRVLAYISYLSVTTGAKISFFCVNCHLWNVMWIMLDLDTTVGVGFLTPTKVQLLLFQLKKVPERHGINFWIVI